MSMEGRRVFKEFLSSPQGRMGVILLSILIIISLYVLSTYPLDFGVRLWNNPAVWADNPKAAPPLWVNLFNDHRKVEHRVFEASRPGTRWEERGRMINSYIFKWNHPFDEPPTFLSFTLSNVTFWAKPPIITLTLSRPDGRQIQLYRLIIPGPRGGEEPPYLRYHETPFRTYLSGDKDVANRLSAFLRREFNISIHSSLLLREGLDRVIFGSPLGEDLSVIQLLKGEYEVDVRIALYDPRDSIGMVRFVVGGSVYGLMGTDSLGRDLAVGLLFGFPVALFIGLVTSTLTTAIGTFMGILSGYKGGKTDLLIQRGSDILANIPLLPILIFLALILGQKLWIVILILIAFGWPGLTILIRAMVLQIRSSQFVEAAIAMGASPWRIMLRHIFPQTAPFVFSQLIFFTPSAILAEAALSFLGLGDPSLPTWGQILEAGFRSGGVYVGYWWWVIPPGLLIVLTAFIFVLIALALEPIVNPRLRRF